METKKRSGHKIEKTELLGDKRPGAPPEVAKNVAPKQLPSVGRIVLYHGTGGEVIGPAIISRLQAVPGVVDLHVFESDGGVHLRTGVQNTNISGWMWPERTGA